MLRLGVLGFYSRDFDLDRDLDFDFDFALNDGGVKFLNLGVDGLPTC